MRAKRLLTLLAALLCLVAPCTIAARARAADLSGLVGMVNEARATFRAVTADDVARARSAVQKQLLELTGTVGTGKDWRDYLFWDQQLLEFNRAGPDSVDLWRRVHARVARDTDLFEQDAFRKYRSALQKLIHCIEAHENPDLAADYQAVLTELSEILLGSGDSFAAADAARVSQLLTQLHHQQQAPKLIASIRQHAARPNLIIEIPANALASDRHFKETFAFRHVVRGSPVESSGTLEADQSSRLKAGADAITMKSVVTGASKSSSLGFGNGVTVRSSGSLKFTSAASMLVNLEGVTAGGFETSGVLQTEILGVSTNYTGRAAVRARQTVYSRQEADRQVAERRALDDLDATFDTRLDGLIAPLQAAYLRNFYLPLIRHDRLPQRSQFVSSAQRATAQLWFADDVQLAAPGDPPWSPEAGGQLRLAIHESAVNNTSALLAGRVRSLVSVLNGEFFEYVAETAKPSERIDVRFHRDAAIRATLGDGTLEIRLVGTEFIIEGSTYPGMEIALRYRLEDETLPVLRLAEPPQVVSHVPAGEDHARFGVRGIALRRILSNVLQEHAHDSLDLTEITLPEPFNGAGKFHTQRLAIADGWLIIEAVPGANAGEIPAVRDGRRHGR